MLHPQNDGQLDLINFIMTFVWCLVLQCVQWQDITICCIMLPEAPHQSKWTLWPHMVLSIMTTRCGGSAADFLREPLVSCRAHCNLSTPLRCVFPIVFSAVWAIRIAVAVFRAFINPEQRSSHEHSKLIRDSQAEGVQLGAWMKRTRRH